MSKNWTYIEGKALISVYASRKKEYFKTRNKKHFWENILTELESQVVLVSATTIENVEIKWRSLYRAYKTAKDRGTGTTPTKFLYMDEMEEIYRDNPIVCSKNSVSVGLENKPDPVHMRKKTLTKNTGDSGMDVSTTSANSSKPCKKKEPKECLKAKSLELKRKYYEEIIEEKKKKRELLEKYIQKKEEDRGKKNQLILSLLTK